MAAEKPNGVTVPSAGENPVALRCNAPQRVPRAPDTAWGRPRGKLGWSLRELSLRTGINPGELSRIERGRSCPSPEQAGRIVDVYRAEDAM
jgi:ribosome-binding protein aMBF1 (putative translation factor)